MLVDATSNRRCVIWFGTPSSSERQLLAASGWSVRVVGAQTPPDPGIRVGDVVVGLLDMREEFSAYIPLVNAWLQRLNPSGLLAFTAGRRAIHPPELRDLLEQCQQVFPMPLDANGFTTRLNAAVSSQDNVSADDALEEMIGESEALLCIKASLRRFGPIDLPVLITGETGTGKEVAARALHGLSHRAERPFAALNCGALPASLVQSELFGHERGAFTGATTRRAGLFEAAEGGSVFLDEIGDLPLEAQTNLLRVLQEGSIERVGSRQPLKVNVRVIAATHVDLEQAIAQGRFREDLYYRLNVLRLHMPALRERGDDIVKLAQHFLTRFRRQHRIRAQGFTEDAQHAMTSFSWPGNVRELLNRVQRAAIVADSTLLDANHLELAHLVDARTPALTDARGQAEREALYSALQACNGNISACARRMRISRVTVYRLCRKHRVAL